MTLNEVNDLEVIFYYDYYQCKSWDNLDHQFIIIINNMSIKCFFETDSMFGDPQRCYYPIITYFKEKY
jgi:hypothetical protein